MGETETELPQMSPAMVERIRQGPVTIDLMLKVLPPILRDYLQENLSPLAQRLAALEGRRGPAADGQATSALDLDPDLNPVNRELIEGCVAHVKEVTAPLLARLETLERREVLAFRGVWRSSGAPYPRGSLCSHAGGLWHANSPTSSRPGTDPSWTLAVKKGGGGDAT